MGDGDETVIVEDLVVRYGDKVAVNGVSFRVYSGEIFGLLGPNGAGKTSTIKALLGLVKYDGSVRILGKPPTSVDVKNSIGYVPEESMLIEHLTPSEFFEFVASVRRLKNVNERLKFLVHAFGLDKYVDTPIVALSMGTRQKVSVVAALMHNPRMLILDEPFNGLDAKSTRVFKELITKHVSEGGSVIFSTHILEIAEKMCDRIAVIDKGGIIAEGSMEELRRMSDGTTLEDIFLKLTGQYEEIAEILSEF